MTIYSSQRVAYPYFVLSLLLFGLQVLLGLVLASNYSFTLPQWIVDLFHFGTARAFHTNLLVLWLLLGFMGGTYFMIPEDSSSELYSVKIAYAQLIILAGTGVVALIGFALGWTQGVPLLEIPPLLDILVVVGALMFLFNVGMTLIKAKHWTAISGSLLAGLVFLALMYLFGHPFYNNLSTQFYWWWWVIHLWVEASWELVAAALMAWIIMRITGVERQVVEKWLYVELGLFLFTGLVGTGHHYYWIGTPEYWYWWGGIFSALEPLPILLMVIDTMHHVKKRKLEIANPVVWTFAIGSAFIHFVGAGVLGIVHTLPQINYFTHGSTVTVAHGHFAFWGAYALLNLTIFYYAIPKLKGFERYKSTLGNLGFWTTNSLMIMMVLAFGVAGVLQSYLERKMGFGFMTAQGEMQFWFQIVLGFGIFFFIGVLIIIYDLLTLKKRAIT
jgi:nitric oxide reductase subunit B